MTEPKDFKAMTLRMDDELAGDLELAARVEGVSANEMVRRAIAARIEELRNDEDFQLRLKQSIERDREILERLART